MTLDFKFPDLGEGVTEGEIKKWLVKEGDVIKSDQPIAEVETDKAVVEMPSPVAGKVLKLYFAEGATVKVGQVLATIGAEGEAPSQRPAPVAAAPSVEEPRRRSVSVVGELPEGEVMVSSTAPTSTQSGAAGVMATPAVRKVAKDLAVDLSTVKGTGPEGRITLEDVKAAAQAGPPSGPAPQPPPASPRKVAKFDVYGYVDREPVKGIRKATAKRMMESTLKTAMVCMMDDADVTELVALRERIKAVAMEQRKVKLTYMPFIIKAVTMALKDNKYLNASIDEETEDLLIKKYYNIGVAVAIEDGLMVPVIKAADQKEIMDLAIEIEELAEKAQSRKIDLGDLKGGTFTITNYGTLGGTYGTPIINYPEAAILGVGRIRDMPMVKDGEIKVRKMLPLSLTWDHRVTDGANAAKFMGTLRNYLENPELILAMH
jgi:pyruvate dehydrogenase E2 component (dihydrolipoamide acetyltransferase)